MPDCLHRSCFVRNCGNLPQDSPQFLPYDPQLTTFRHSCGYHSVFFVILQDRTSVLNSLFCALFLKLFFAYVASGHSLQRKILCLPQKKNARTAVIQSGRSEIFFFFVHRLPPPYSRPGAPPGTMSKSVDGIHCLRRLGGRGMKKSFAEYPGRLVAVSS